MTVYDRCHMGHARAMVVFDAFVRYLRFRGWDVNFVRNFTDVDDKIIARQERGNPIALAARFIRPSMRTPMLWAIRPDAEPKVSDTIDDIEALIGSLVDKGNAYVNEGTVWFDVKSMPSYGQLSGQNVDALQSPDTVPGKRHPADFALWKAVKPGEPSWESPWGPGRPGWHIECSAMSMGCIGPTLDIHGGGLDLVFPHHENEVAQSEAHTHETYANYWMHNGMLTMASGQKMGKSLGNVWNVRTRSRSTPRRPFACTTWAPSAGPLPWGDDALSDALGSLCRLYEARSGRGDGGEEDAARVASDLGEDAATVLSLSEGFEEPSAALDDDFNTAKAMASVFELVRAVNRFGNHKKAKKRGGPVVAGALKALDLVSETLGILTMSVEDFQNEVKLKRCNATGICRDSVEARIAERTQARADKDWARSDALRDELDAEGIVLMDGADTTTWRMRICENAE